MAKSGQYVVNLLTTSYEEAKEKALEKLKVENWTESCLRKRKDNGFWELKYRVPNSQLLR